MSCTLVARWISLDATIRACKAVSVQQCLTTRRAFDEKREQYHKCNSSSKLCVLANKMNHGASASSGRRQVHERTRVINIIHKQPVGPSHEHRYTIRERQHARTTRRPPTPCSAPARCSCAPTPADARASRSSVPGPARELRLAGSGPVSR